MFLLISTGPSPYPLLNFIKPYYQIKIFDRQGHHLESREITHAFEWDGCLTGGECVASGVYNVMIYQGETLKETTKVIVIK